MESRMFGQCEADKSCADVSDSVLLLYELVI